MVSGVQQYHMAQGVPPPYVAPEESLLGTKLIITRNSKLVPPPTDPSTSHLPLREVDSIKKYESEASTYDVNATLHTQL